jgi:hypothetical protein
MTASPEPLQAEPESEPAPTPTPINNLTRPPPFSRRVTKSLFIKPASQRVRARSYMHMRR